jgi:hypothetical protein
VLLELLASLRKGGSSRCQIRDVVVMLAWPSQSRTS